MIPKGAPALLTVALTTALTLFSETAAGQDGETQPQPTLESLQEQIDALKAKQEETPTIGSALAKVKLFGRIHADVWTFPDSNEDINVFESGDPNQDPQNNIEFRRARIGVSGDLHEYMLYKAEIDFGKPNGLVFKDLYFGFKNIPVVQTLLIGNQKRPYGLDHLNSSRFNVFIERPFIVEALNQDARRGGVLAYGTTEELDWNWRWGVFSMEDYSSSGDIVTEDFQPEVTGRIANTAWWADGGRNYAHWAVSGSLAWPNGEPDGAMTDNSSNQADYRTRPEARSQSRWLDTGAIDGAHQALIGGVEGAINLGPTQVVTEFLHNSVQRGGGDPDFYGGYVYVSHFLTGEHMPWSRKSGTLGRPKPKRSIGGKDGGFGAWQIGARFSYADFTDNGFDGGVGQSVTLGLNWYWNPHASVQLNYIKGWIDDRNVTVGGTVYEDGDYDVIGVRFRVDF